MQTEPALLIGLLAGLFGSTHCLVMCGGISAMLHSQIRPGPGQYLIAAGFHAGRLSSYLLLGLLLALLGMLPGWLLPDGAGPVMRTLLGVAVALMGIALLTQRQWAEFMGRYTGPLVRRITPIIGRQLPLRSPWKALGVGMLWGLIPCGLLYSVLAVAWLQADLAGSSALLLGFGLGTLPAMGLGGLAALRLRLTLRKNSVKLAAAAMMTITGVLIAAGPLLMQHLPHSSAMQFLIDCVAR